MHHMFTSPRDEDIEYLESDPGRVKAKAYDLVLNGTEIGGGSIRIYNRELQERVFTAIGFSAEECNVQIWFYVRSF